MKNPLYYFDSLLDKTQEQIKRNDLAKVKNDLKFSREIVNIDYEKGVIELHDYFYNDENQWKLEGGVFVYDYPTKNILYQYTYLLGFNPIDIMKIIG